MLKISSTRRCTGLRRCAFQSIYSCPVSDISGLRWNRSTSMSKRWSAVVKVRKVMRNTFVKILNWASSANSVSVTCINGLRVNANSPAVSDVPGSVVNLSSRDNKDPVRTLPLLSMSN